MESERPPILSGVSEDFLQILAEHAPEENDNVVIENFKSKISDNKSSFEELTKDQQYAVALFDRLPKQILEEIQLNHFKFGPPKPDLKNGEVYERYKVGLHDIANTFIRLEYFTGQIQNRKK